MKKKTTLLLLMAFSLLTAMAAPITQEQAQKRATAFLRQCKGSSVLTPVAANRTGMMKGKADKATTPYYVFDRGQNEGFVIVSGDDQTIDVLGYCDQGTFDYKQMPEAMREWLDDYAAQIAYLQRTPGARLSAAVPTHPALPKLMTTTWNQGNPYNLTCPDYFGQGRSVTGCVATAMAQILYYQRAKSVTTIQANIPAYVTGNNLNVEGINEGAPIDWDNMRNSYSGSETQAQRLAVANLMLYCGVSVRMDYTNSSSGAYSFDVATALRRYFGYGNSVQYIRRSAYSNVSWDATIYNELANGNAVYLSGANSGGGHAFVCDGYDGKRYYHINWGWGGTSDGFYLLSKLTPGEQGIGGSNDGYNSGQDAIIGIVPEHYENNKIPFADATVKSLCVAQWDANGDGELSFGEAAAVTDLGTTFKGQPIKTFNELMNFTALEQLADDAFNGCNALQNVKLPTSLTAIGARAFSGCETMRSLLLPGTVTTLGEEAFSGCKTLATLSLPDGVKTVSKSLFEDCAMLTSITLPTGVTAIGDRAFAGCEKLVSMTVNSGDASAIAIGSDLFDGIDLSAATLNVLQGGKASFGQAPQWQAFGTIHEMRSLPEETFAPIAEGKQFYVVNVGTGRYLTHGEAYDTQATVSDDPIRYTLHHVDGQPADIYYLHSDETGKTGKILYRTDQDYNVGMGVKATFVDGQLTENAYWSVKAVGDNTYTIQTPPTDPAYNKDEYLGILTTHASDAASPTNGAYYDVKYAGNEANCQWAFVDYDATYGIYYAAQELEDLLVVAKNKKIDATREQNVLDNLESTYDDIITAQRTLRKKLGYIHFSDETMKTISLSNWDIDGDGELSLTEANLVSDLGSAFYRSNVKSLDDLQYFTSLSTLYGNSFEDCKLLTSIKLPESVKVMYYRIFYGCESIERVDLPAGLRNIGSSSFQGCTALKTVSIAVTNPDVMAVSDDIFEGLNLKDMTLFVPFGSKDAYAAHSIWGQFGTIKEMRTKPQPAFAKLDPSKKVYVYNVGQSMFLNRGEAYGTQSVVANTGLLYQVKQLSTVSDDCYYLECVENGMTGKIVFRTNTDSRVGDGTQACFYDGSLSSKAHWIIRPAGEEGENVYTIQTPENDALYLEGRYLGVDLYHDTEVTYPTYGIYPDVNIENAGQSCHWAFITEEELNRVSRVGNAYKELEQLLALADKRNIDATDEHAVYDSFESTDDDIADAITNLRDKMGLISFADAKTKDICISSWDMDNDGELSKDEAAAVTEISKSFRLTSIKSFDELQYFTGLTSLPEGTFLSCASLVSICLPATITELGNDAFSRCTNLKYLVSLNPDATTLTANLASLPRLLKVFVPKENMDSYENDDFWKKFTLMEYTGQPIVTVTDAERIYGRSTTRFNYTLEGAPINGEPAIICENDVTTPAGQYPIVATAGTITTLGVKYVEGTLTVEKAPLTATAKSYTRLYGEENPEFEVTYKTFKNREKSDVFTKQPIVECDATPESPVGTYEIRVYGAEADNYEFTYENGTLTVEADPLGIDSIEADGSAKAGTYDLSGRRVEKTQLKRGVYVRNGRKVVVK